MSYVDCAHWRSAIRNCDTLWRTMRWPAPTRSIFILLLATGCVCSAGGGLAGLLEAQGAVSLGEGDRLFKEHDLARAELVTREYLVTFPRSAPAMYLLGAILEGRKQAADSLDWFTKAASIEPPTGEQLRVVAMDYILLGDYPDALRWLRRSVEMDPANAEAWYGLGRTLMTQGEMRAARGPLERALALKPGQAKVANNLGVIAESEAHPDEAEALYRQAIAWQRGALQPSEQPLLNLGVLLLSQQKNAEAQTLLQQAVVLAPSNSRCHEQLAKVFSALAQPSKAVAELERAVLIEPQSAPLHFELGQALRQAGDPERAKRELSLSGRLYGTHSSEVVGEMGKSEH